MVRKEWRAHGRKQIHFFLSQLSRPSCLYRPRVVFLLSLGFCGRQRHGRQNAPDRVFISWCPGALVELDRYISAFIERSSEEMPYKPTLVEEERRGGLLDVRRIEANFYAGFASALMPGCYFSYQGIPHPSPPNPSRENSCLGDRCQRAGNGVGRSLACSRFGGFFSLLLAG